VSNVVRGFLVVRADETPSVVTSTRRARVYVTTPLAQRFWAKVNKNGPVPTHRPEVGQCWLWTGARDDQGYGSIKEGGRGSRLLKAHRVSWALHHGKLSDSINVLHECDNPACVRDSHLFVGTFADNSRDAAAKGRTVYQAHPERIPHGESAGGAKLSATDVEAIRKLRARGWTQRRIAGRFGVTQAAISLVLLGKTWKHPRRIGATAR